MLCYVMLYNIYRRSEKSAGGVDGQAGNTAGVRLESVDKVEISRSGFLPSSINVGLHMTSELQQSHYAVIKPSHYQ